MTYHFVSIIEKRKWGISSLRTNARRVFVRSRPERQYEAVAQRKEG